MPANDPPNVLKEKPPKQFRVLEGLLTVKQVCYLFRVSTLTIWKWRENRGLPHIIIPGEKQATIRYDLDELKVWAEKHGEKTYAIPKKVMNAGLPRRAPGNGGQKKR